MSTRNYKAKRINWIDIVDPSKKEVDELVLKYGFHELDKEALLEDNQRARVDTYEDYIFIVLHFPKYDTKTKRYILNEFNIFLSKKFLITIRYHTSTSVDRVFDNFMKWVIDEEDIHPWYILYDVIDAMMDKIFRLFDKFSKDLRILESEIFKQTSKNLINEIMIKKRNVITLKHMLNPQIQVLKMLELRTNSLFKDEFEVYFENLIDKLEKISSEIQILQENIESMEDTLKSIFDMQTNTSVKYLTIFSAFMLPLTLVTGFFWMNIDKLPFDDILVYTVFLLVSLFMILISFYLIRAKKL